MHQKANAENQRETQRTHGEGGHQHSQGGGGTQEEGPTATIVHQGNRTTQTCTGKRGPCQAELIVSEYEKGRKGGAREGGRLIKRTRRGRKINMKGERCREKGKRKRRRKSGKVDEEQ